MKEFPVKVVAIKKYWPKQKVAEHEVISRIEIALGKLGYSILLIDENGLRLDNGQLIQAGDALFCLDLHFLTPKVFPGISVGALWNPPDFHALFGLAASIDYQFSHDLYVAANIPRSKSLLSLVAPNYSEALLPLNHTVPGDFLEPKKSGALNVFYIGIGWDKTAGFKGRHHDLIRELEKRTQVEVYGPTRLADGTRPWGGLRSYVGPLPFDGKSVIEQVNKSGFALAFSSESHRAAGILSNRVFEAIAGGALPIVESDIESPFNLDEAIKIDVSVSNPEIARSIADEVRLLTSNREEFYSRVLALQEKMRNGFVLESQLQALINYCEGFSLRRSSNNRVIAEVCYLPSVVRLFLNLKRDTLLNSEHYSCLSSLTFQRFLREYLRSSGALWLSFLDENSKLAIGDDVQTDVIVLSGCSYSSESQRVTSIPGGFAFFSALKIMVSRELVLAWLDNPSGLLSISLLWKLIAIDVLSGKPHMDIHFDSSNFLQIEDAHLFPVDSLLSVWDLEIIRRGRLPEPNDQPIRAFFTHAVSVINAKTQLNAKTEITYLEIFRALSRIPAARLPGILFAGLRHLVTIRVNKN